MRAGVIVVMVLGACGGSPGAGDDIAGDDVVPDAEPITGDGGYPGTGDDLDTAVGCAGIYNPDQVLEFHLTMAAGDWSAVQSDCAWETYYPADLQCGDGPSIRVGVRHKRSGGRDRPGLKIDINEFVAGQELYSLRKMAWENGVGSTLGGCGEDGTSASSMLTEYLGWRLHVRSGEMTSRAAFIHVTVNGDPIGAYLNVEEVDKPFVKRHLGDASGWIWKFSGGAGDGQQTNDGVDDPYDDALCYLEKNGCAAPSASTLAAELPALVDIPQLLSVAAVNAMIANHDGLWTKFNNYIFYDWAGPRAYFAWDLDSTMADDYDVFTGTVSGGTTVFTDVMYTNWEDDYDQVLTELLAGPLALDEIHAEIDRAVTVAGPTLEADPYIEGTAAAAGEDLAAWWTARHAAVSAQVAGH